MTEDEDKKKIAEKVEQVIQLMSEIPNEHLEKIVEYCKDKEATYGLFHNDDMDTIRKRCKRAEAFLDFRKVLEETDKSRKKK